MSLTVIEGGGQRATSRLQAELDREAVIDRVAMAIWHDIDDMPQGLNWPDAQHLPELSVIVEWTRKAACAAVCALIIGDCPAGTDWRMALAGQHRTGLDPHTCMETFDAMLAGVLA